MSFRITKDISITKDILQIKTREVDEHSEDIKFCRIENYCYSDLFSLSIGFLDREARYFCYIELTSNHNINFFLRKDLK